MTDECWFVPAYDAATFSGSGSMTWTVDPADIASWTYLRFGKTVIASFVLNTTSVGGTLTNELRIALPASMTVARNALAAIRVREAGVAVPGYVNVRLNQPYLFIQKLDAAVFSATTNTTDIQGQIIFEVI